MYAALRSINNDIAARLTRAAASRRHASKND
jgi:hypothetical protein